MQTPSRRARLLFTPLSSCSRAHYATDLHGFAYLGTQNGIRFVSRYPSDKQAGAIELFDQMQIVSVRIVFALSFVSSRVQNELFLIAMAHISVLALYVAQYIPMRSVNTRPG